MTAHRSAPNTRHLPSGRTSLYHRRYLDSSAESQSRPSYSPWPCAAHAAWMYHCGEEIQSHILHHGCRAESCNLTPVPLLSSPGPFTPPHPPRQCGPGGRRPPGTWRTPSRPRGLVAVTGRRGAFRSPRAPIGYPLRSGRLTPATSVSPRTTVIPISDVYPIALVGVGLNKKRLKSKTSPLGAAAM